MKALSRNLAGAAAIAGIGFWIYLPAIRGAWVWDDAVEVAQNPLLRDPEGLRKIWLAPPGPDYFPLKDTVEWVEWHLFGANTAGYHLVSVCLHIASALLIWRLLSRLGLRLGFLGGLLFVAHPSAVESVAWISELKNTLSLPPLLLSVLAYLRFDEQSDEQRGQASDIAARRNIRGLTPYPHADVAGVADPGCRPQRGRLQRGLPPYYFFSLFWFVVAMLCKSSVVMLPVVLLLYVGWRRGGIGRRSLLATLPFFAVSLGLGLVTTVFQVHRALRNYPLELGGAVARPIGAGISLAFYTAKACFPVNLVPVYPRWTLAPSLVQALPGILLISVFAWLWTLRARGGRGALFGVGSFWVNLAPVLSFVPMAFLRFTWVSDHLAYVALAALAVTAGAGLSLWVERGSRGGPRPALLAAACVAGLAAMAFEGHAYAAQFRGNEAFMSAIVGRNPGCWMAQNDLGQTLAKDGRWNEAIGRYREALRIKPDYGDAWVNLGNALVGSGKPAQAVDSYERALELEPGGADTRVYLGFALAQAGRLTEAIAQYEQALRLKPGDAQAELYLGSALAHSGDSHSAEIHLRESLRIDPDNPEAHYDLANALGNAGRLSDAIGEYREALRLRPGYAEAHANLGLALEDAGRREEGMAELDQALRLKPDYAEAHAYLGLALAQSGRLEEAVEQYEEALKLAPGNADVQYQLAAALKALGRGP